MPHITHMSYFLRPYIFLRNNKPVKDLNRNKRLKSIEPAESELFIEAIYSTIRAGL